MAETEITFAERALARRRLVYLLSPTSLALRLQRVNALYHLWINELKPRVILDLLSISGRECQLIVYLSKREMMEKDPDDRRKPCSLS